MFLHPLKSRETYTTSWDQAVPFVSSWVDSHPTPTVRFRHRPRVGRGGRLVIDRLPTPAHAEILPVTVFTAGKGLARSVEPSERLMDLIPKPLDHVAVSRQIEELCATAIKEDFEAAAVPLAGQPHETDDNDCEEVVVKMEDWASTDEQVWGEERFAIGPV
mmetsp:Transcript_34251/g.79012  ORF Transcript_34251/g.79012 Transcript_34251/m.79012 type:complete len:161 (-) Transcript_34251:2115-2597(-)